jgi:hypothetical protein
MKLEPAGVEGAREAVGGLSIPFNFDVFFRCSIYAYIERVTTPRDPNTCARDSRVEHTVQ